MRNFITKYKDPVIKGLKELARIAVLAALPLIIASLETGVIEWKAITLVAVIAVLKAIDKAVHKYGEQTGNVTLKRGLTQF